jgi:hypothetical protein
LLVPGSSWKNSAHILIRSIFPKSFGFDRG